MKTIEQQADELIKELTLEEKASLCSGRDEWTFKPIDRLDIPGIWVADGPHGLRKSPNSSTGGFGDQIPATCFPTASALSATWNKELIREVGKYLAIECQALNVNIILGPGVNIKRSPTGGRNFEYFSEDPVLSGELGAAYINGIQNEGVGTSLKHFACNSQETQRMMVSAEISERTMREIYLTNFEIAIKKANPWTVMAAYNPVNGTDSTSNKYLLNDILKDEWGYEGIVISDWVSVHNRIAGIKAGMHVEMPGNDGMNDKKIVDAVKSGKLDEKQIDKLVKETLKLVFKAKAVKKKGVTFNHIEHHKYARKVAGETIVLLKNENNLLPITKEKYNKVALLGEFSISPRFQGNGSSEVKPTYVDNAKDEIIKLAGDDFKVDYAQAYKISDDNDLSLINEAVAIASNADIAIIHIGLPSHYESEGYDRKHIEIPPAQIKLIKETVKVQKNIVVVLTNGAAISMPWLNNVSAVLEAWLGGQAGGGAIADTLFGKVNPSGKLAETFPQRLEDTPAFMDFPGMNRKLFYGEGIFVGYRWYEKRKIEPLFPFGFGLSYTSFEYSNLKLSKEKITEKETLIVTCNVKNIGDRAGKEIVQLYVSDKESRLIRPIKELKGFEKINLEAGAESIVSFELKSRDFSYFDDKFNSWITESGEFKISMGASSKDIRLKKSLLLNTVLSVKVPFDTRTSLREWISYPETKELVYPIVEDYFKKMPTEFEGELIDFKIKNDFFLDMPMMKYVNLSRGSISKECILKLIEDTKKIRIKL